MATTIPLWRYDGHHHVCAAPFALQSRSGSKLPIKLPNINCVRTRHLHAVAQHSSHVHDVVIVGAGIAGLATALSLHRLGVKSTVLEQSDTLRATGSTIGIWTNAWRALDALGVADGLRKDFERISRIEFYAADGKCLKSMGFEDQMRPVELRGVERKALLEALREPLLPDTVCYNAQVVGIQKIDGGYTEIELQNGSFIKTKVLVGCDGIGSVVARWMGLKDPRYVGYVAIRGVGVYPEGHSLKNVVRQTLGRGVRSGSVPMDSHRVYWFVVFNSSSGGKITDPELVREEALSYVKGWPSVVIDVIKRSPPETLSRSKIADRWMWPFVGPALSNGGVTLAGDAMHPLTPNLGQGGCCALEDAVILGRTLYKALGGDCSIERETEGVNKSLKGADTSQKMKIIEAALQSYTNERRHRMLPMAVRSYIIGAVLQVDFELVCLARDKLLPKLLKLERFIDHTFYDCGKL